MQSLARIALVEQGFPRTEHLPDRFRSQQLQLGLRKTGKQGCLLQNLCQINTLRVQLHPSNHAFNALENRTGAIGGQ
jgi:hypothetical protein